MPSANYEGLNVSTGTGEGDANVLHWGAVDKAADRIYQDQLRRRALAQQNYQMQQAQFQKELGSIRSADIPDAVNAYQNRKSLSKQLMFDKKLHDDPIAYAQKELELKQANADYYGVLNSSKETMLNDKNISEDLLKNHDLYAPDASDKLQQWNNIPTSERRKQNLLGNGTLLSTLPDVDYANIVKESVGDAKDMPAGKETLSEDKQTFITPYKSMANQPEQIKDNIIGKFDVRKAGKDATKILNQIPAQAITDINDRYAQIPNDQYKQLYGKDKPNLDPKNPDNPVEIIASYEAKKQVVTNPPKPAKPVTRTNLDYAANLAFEHAKTLAAIKHGYDKDLLAAKQQYKKLDKAGQGVYLDKIIQSQIDEAKGAGAYTYNDGKGNSITEYQMKVSPMTKAIFKVGDAYPDAVRIMPNGDIHPIFYKYEKDPTTGVQKPIPSKTLKGAFEIDKQLSQPVSKEEYKIRLGQQLLSDKGLDKELYDQFGDEESGESGSDNESNEVPDFLKR